MQNKYLKIAIFLLTVLSVACAKIGSPTGGPKDEDPPKVAFTKPPDSTVNFVPRKKIVITFNEFIELKEPFQEVILSPQIKEQVLTSVKGKNVVVEFPKDIQYDTTTYTLSFGNSIVDFNEGNVLKNYEFIFSLKDYIDSMNIEGTIVNAFDHKPNKDRMYVMLYKNLSDSAPLKEKPKFISRTNDKGQFNLHNLETGSYRLFALKDANSNLLFDVPDEQIAFADSIIELNPERFKKDVIIDDSLLYAQLINEDSIKIDSSIIITGKIDEQVLLTDSIYSDTISNDSLLPAREYLYFTEMVYFTQKSKNQYMTNNLRNQPELLFFSFNLPLEGSLLLTPLNFETVANWLLPDINKNNDTLKYWITDTAVISIDSLQLEVCFPAWDSTGNRVNTIDTLFMVAKRPDRDTGRARRGRERSKEESNTAEKEPAKKLELSNNIINPGAFDLNKEVKIIAKSPMLNIIPKRVQMFRIEDDTLEIPIKTEIFYDTVSLYKYSIKYQPEELTTYKILIPDSTITDIYGFTNDTTIIKFRTQAEDYYGILTLHLTNVSDQGILQLLDEKENILNERIIKGDQDIKYEYLFPKTFLVKYIVDSNGNGVWDTGNYLKKLQPERVIYFPQILNIRSNWEIDFNWDIGY